MKTLIPFTLAAALAASGISQAQTPAFSKPSGYVTETLKTGFNLVGFTLLPSPVASGNLETVTASSVVDQQLVFTPVSGALYILEITSGTGEGVIQEVPSTSISGTTISLTQDITGLGVQAGNTFSLRKAPTLEEIFGTTATVLKTGFTAIAADIVWIPDGNGGYDRYFLNGSGAWRNVAGGAAPNIPILFTDGIFVQRKDANVDLVLTGTVKTNKVKTRIIPGFNLVGTSFPAGSTLQNIGFEATLKSGFTAISADIVWIPTGSGEFTRFFYNGTAWRNVAGGAATANFPITSAIFVQRKDPAANLTLTPPANYSNL